MPDDQVVGKNAQVISRIAPGNAGEVMIAVRGGSEVYSAHAASTIERGSVVRVLDHYAPRSVRVALLET